MKKLFLAFLMTTSMFFSNANDKTIVTNVADEYTINDMNVETMFTSSIDITNDVASNVNITNVMNSQKSTMMMKSGSGKSAIAAIAIDFFLGGLGIHRIYLGTKTMTWVGYILSCGGIFGLLPLGDFIFMIVNYNNIDKYVDNPKFFMW
jgi:TM2 domain-containing membrane protein YozV